MCLQIDLLNTQKKFPFSICKNVDATSKKSILIARFKKCKAVADYMEMGKSSFVFILETDSNFQNKLFTGELAFQLCTRLEKFACPSLKIKAGLREKTWFDYQKKTLFIYFFVLNSNSIFS